MIDLKQKIINECNALLQQKIANLKSALATVNEAANNETKSTAGDKHETAKAMMQLEQEKLSAQITILNTQVSELQKIDCTKKYTQITNGSLVTTNKGILFIGVGLGKIKINDEVEVFAISYLSPLAQLLINNKVNHSVSIGAANYTISAIF